MLLNVGASLYVGDNLPCHVRRSDCRAVTMSRSPPVTVQSIIHSHAFMLLLPRITVRWTCSPYKMRVKV